MYESFNELKNGSHIDTNIYELLLSYKNKNI